MATINRRKIPAERLHPKAAYSRCRPVAAIRRAGLGAEKLSFTPKSLGSRPTFQAKDQRWSRSGSVEILLELMANGADSDNVATHFKCGNEPGASEGNDEFTLLVVQGASSLAA